MFYRLAFAILANLAAHLPAAAQVASAQLRGAILDELGRPLSGARVLYTGNSHLIPEKDGKSRNAPGPRRFSSQVVTDSSGRYAAAKLAAGDYYLCVSAAGYLTTCEWAQWRRTTVAPGQALDIGAIQLTKRGGKVDRFAVSGRSARPLGPFASCPRDGRQR